MAENIFADEWHQCLEAHYMHVVRNNDRVTQPSLTLVMHQAGFSDSELAELRVRATMHIDEVSEDFVPDLQALNPVSESVPVAAPTDVPSTSEEVVVIAVPENSEAAVEAAPDDMPAEDELDERELDEEPLDEIPEQPEDDPDAPQQLSLF